MTSSKAGPFAKLLLTAGALSLTAVTGCGVFGKSWDVKLEVVGGGSGNISYAFSGDNDGKSETGQKLPWSRSQNVGFGFNDVSVTDAEPGTACRIYVDGKLKDEQRKPDAKGGVSCSVNLQD
ncbi:MmpS family transport accessory protein [Streptomyces sp. NPDC058001]|uniref:MmpS family transport accessory protein n=1 Tax=Streptomyces sp. NPDC058001 TaxID=3346300 RepID=UPI0036EE21FE